MLPHQAAAEHHRCCYPPPPRGPKRPTGEMVYLLITQGRIRSMDGSQIFMSSWREWRTNESSADNSENSRQ
jgi:hypothetical protein